MEKTCMVPGYSIGINWPCIVTLVGVAQNESHQHIEFYGNLKRLKPGGHMVGVSSYLAEV
jgi:hypothetical protein